MTFKISSNDMTNFVDKLADERKSFYAKIDKVNLHEIKHMVSLFTQLTRQGNPISQDLEQRKS
jgi:hypothetical protein